MEAFFRLLPTSPTIIRMEIKMHLPYEDVFQFLQKKGYEIKPWLHQFEDETFPGGKTYHEIWTFTATKGNEPQTERSLFLTVFETEFKNILKDI